MSDTIRPVENSSGAIVGFARFPPGADVPVIRTVADAEALFGRGAAVILARGGVAECLAAEAPLIIAVPPGGWQASDVLTTGGTSALTLAPAPPPVDLAAENAALRAALAASGELLAEAHAEIDRLRGAT